MSRTIGNNCLKVMRKMVNKNKECHRISKNLRNYVKCIWIFC